MTLADIIGSTGVAMILIAFFLNITNIISTKNFGYILMNFVGATLACYASVLLRYIPFIILEATWATVSLVALLNYFFRWKS